MVIVCNRSLFNKYGWMAFVCYFENSKGTSIMFYAQCWKCGERWGLGTASTCKCPDETPQHTWQGLTDEDIALIDWESLVTRKDCVRAIEAKLKEKNHA
jgi:hypothetical protein